MRLPGSIALFFLAYLLAFLPWLAFRSARQFRVRDSTAAAPFPSREAIWTGTLVNQGVMFVLAWLTGRGFGYRIFAVSSFGAREVLAGLAALGASFILRTVARRLRSEEERRGMVVYLLAPRTTRERMLWVGTGLAASVAEEAAYRGVGMAILWYALGNAWLAALICATAFSLAHWTQGWKSAAVILAMALVMHGLVAVTGLLVIAMAVHAIYDLVAGTLISREAVRLEREHAVAR